MHNIKPSHYNHMETLTHQSTAAQVAQWVAETAPEGVTATQTAHGIVLEGNGEILPRLTPRQTTAVYTWAATKLLGLTIYPDTAHALHIDFVGM